MRVLLAPMEGVLDSLVRELLTEVNDYDLCVTEFLRVVDMLLPEKSFYRLCPELHRQSRTPSGTLVRVQLLGQYPEWLAENAARAVALGSYGVDLNCGCPSKLVNGSVARLYWDWQTEAAVGDVLAQIKREQENIIGADRELYQHGITSSVEGVETDINASKTDEQLADVHGKMKAIEARLNALTNTPSVTLARHALPDAEASLPSTLGYELLARRPDLQEAHWYIEASMSEVDAARAAFYPDINLMAFLQQDALHLSDLFRSSAQQMGVTAGLTLPIFDSGRLNANLDIAQAQNNLSVANYNKAVVDAVNQVARTASEVETLTAKNQHQQQIEKDAARVVALAQARFSAGIIAGSRVSEAKIPALKERIAGLMLKGQYVDATLQLTSALGGGYHHS